MKITTKVSVPAQLGIVLCFVMPTLAGCGQKAPEQKISKSFVPAGFDQTMRPGVFKERNAAMMQQGDPSLNVSFQARSQIDNMMKQHALKSQSGATGTPPSP